MKFISGTTLAAVMAMMLFSTNETGAKPHSQISQPTEDTVPPLIARPVQETFSLVIPPQVPQYMDFAGEKVPLDNYDTQESLERELCITAYMHSRTLISLLNTTRYFPLIDQILARNGVPTDFKYLCLAESGLNPNIISSAGAAGLWQIMPSVGKSYGMEVNGEIDERYNVEKSTQAACDYLKTAYRRFGSWTMAAASYNLGVAGLATRSDRQGTKNYYDLFLPEETLRYVFRILSWKLIAETPARYGYMIASDQYHKPLSPDYKEITVGDKKIDWCAVAAQYGTSYKMMRELNQWIRDYDCANVSGRTYTVKIPQKKFRDQK